jgi:hypothetical protein
MRKLLITAAAAATVVIGPGTTLALGRGDAHHHRGRVHHHAHDEQFGGGASTPHGGTGATGVTGNTGSTAPQPPAPQAGDTVVSLTNGVLTIRLSDGTLVSGSITDATQIKCPSIAGGGDDGNGDGDGGDGNNQRGSNSGHGGPTGGNGDDEGDGNVACTLAAATPGTVVSEAELHVSRSGAVWETLVLVA